MKNLSIALTSIIGVVVLCVGCKTIPVLPDPAAEAGSAFLQACGQREWQKAGELYSQPVPETIKERFGGVEVVHVGQSYERVHEYSGRFVPCKVRFADGKVLKRTLAMKVDSAGNWFVDGGL